MSDRRLTSASRRETDRPTATGLDLLGLVAGLGDQRRPDLTRADRAMDARSPLADRY
jgi:hypothetical protein